MSAVWRNSAAALVIAAAVFAILSPAHPSTWKPAYVYGGLAATIPLVILADDTRVSIAASLAIAAVWFHWRFARAPGREKFAVGAPHSMVADDPRAPEGLDPAFSTNAPARTMFGAGSELPMPDPGMSVADLQELTPPELLDAAQTNEVSSIDDAEPESA